MENSSEARVKVSIKDGIFELSGSEAFVSQQVEKFRELISTAFNRIKDQPAQDDLEDVAANSEAPGPPPAPLKKEAETKTFASVLHFSGDQISLIKTIPGADKAKRTVNVALAYMWAKRSKGVEKVPLPEIRELCEKQGCLDTNFAANIQSAREWIVVEGLRGSRNKLCELTQPGIDEAERFLLEQNGS